MRFTRDENISIKLRSLIFSGTLFIVSFLLHQVASAQFESGAFDFGGITRNFKAVLPGNYSASEKFPVVLNLHPIVYGAQFELSYTRMHLAADSLGYIIVYPSAVDEWNVGGLRTNGELRFKNDDVGFINALIDYLDENYSIDTDKVFACGFSQGGFMSLRLACELGHRFAAIASVGGAVLKHMVGNCNPAHHIGVLLIHGTNDQTVPILGDAVIHSAEWALDYFGGINACSEKNSVLLEDIDPDDACTVEKISYTNCANNGKVVLYRVIGGGHTWPGGNTEQYNEGNTNMDMNASYEILKFFSEFTLTPTSAHMIEKNEALCVYPNPFDSETVLSYQLSESSDVLIRIFNVSGTEIRTLKLQNKAAGSHEIAWDGKNNHGELVSGGLYFISLSGSEINKMCKVIFLR